MWSAPLPILINPTASADYLAFFGRLYAPEVLMGMQTTEEIVDITPLQPASVDAINEKIKAKP